LSRWFLEALLAQAAAALIGVLHTTHTPSSDSIFFCKAFGLSPLALAMPQVLILLMPNFVEATMYTTTSKISAFGQVPREQFWLRPSFISWFYITSDIVTVLVQAAGKVPLP
jgi:hypothetical protein